MAKLSAGTEYYMHLCELEVLIVEKLNVNLNHTMRIYC